MRVCGYGTFPVKFKWTPTQLSSLIKEIDKTCPEEGLLDIENNGRDLTALGTDDILTTE
jgi:hypothetical protein